MKNSIIYMAIAGLAMSSCAAYKEFRPTESLPENLFGIGVASSDTTSLATTDWREIFNDPCLQALVDTAILRNTDYQIALLRTQQALASLDAARLAYFPTLGASVEGNISRGGETTTKSYRLGVDASWEIDIFGRLTAAKRGASAAAVSAEEEGKAVRSQLIATVANSYYSLLMLDRQIEIARTTLDNWSETIRVMELLKSAGLANEPGILQSKADKAALESEIVGMEKNRREIENSLCSLLARTPGKIERGVLGNFSPDKDFATGLPLRILAERPDVRSAEMELARTHYALAEARASFYPNVTLGGTVGFTNDGGIILNPGQWLLNAVGQLVQPIFNRGRLKASYKTAEADREIARLKFSQALLDAGKEVNNALSDIADARRQLALAEEQTALLEEAVRKTGLLMRHSQINYLEVLTAQQSLLNAQQMEVRCRFDLIAGVISLFHALGAGCQGIPVTPAAIPAAVNEYE